MTAVAEALEVLEGGALAPADHELYPSAEVIRVDPEDLDLWLAQRREGIGSSDAPAIVGLDRFRSPFAVWAEKVYGSEQEDNPAMEWGRRLEGTVAGYYADQHDAVLMKPTVMWRSRECPVAQANPDRLILTGETPPPVLEIKTSRLSDEWKDEAPPDRVLVQVQHQLGVTGAPRAVVAVLLHGREYREFAVERDQAAIDFLWEAEVEFWQRVTSQTPPPADGHASTADALRDLYSAVDPGSIVELDLEQLELVRSLARVRAEQKVLEAREDEIANTLRLALGHAEVAVVDGIEVLTAKAQERTSLDVKKLRAERPRLEAALLSRYSKRSTSRPLKPRGDT